MNVWVLVTYYGSSGDAVAAYGKREDAEANALAYTREHWPRDLGEAPTTYAAALDGWELGTRRGADRVARLADLEGKMDESSVWVLRTYSRIADDDVEVFSSRAKAEACVLEHALEYWPSELGAPPSTYDDVVRAWARGEEWGTDTFQWELDEMQVR